MRTRTAAPSGQPSAASARCASIAAATPAAAPAKTKKKESPWRSISVPPPVVKRSGSRRLCRSSSAPYPAAPRRLSSDVDPSMSENRKVTVPLGSGVRDAECATSTPRRLVAARPHRKWVSSRGDVRLAAPPGRETPGSIQGLPPMRTRWVGRRLRSVTSHLTLLHRRPVRIALLAGSTGGALALFLSQAQPGRLWGSLAALPTTAVLAAAGAAMGGGTLGGGRRRSVLAAAGATRAGVMLGAVRWRSLLAAGGVDAPAPKLFAALTIGSAVNNLVPARGGDAVRVESARQLTGAPRLAIAGTMVSERILDGFVLALLVVAGALLEGLGGLFLWAGAAVASALALGAFILGSQSRRFLQGRLSGLADGIAVFRAGRVVAPALGITAGIWLADVVMYGAL